MQTLSATVLDGRYLPVPTDWEAVFGRSAPLIVEIGFGNADHLIHLGQTRPASNVLGNEISHPSIKKAERKIRNRQLPHTRAVYGNAEALLWHHIAPQTIAELHINFPDPWPKEGHHHRRLINDDFMLLAATRMLPSARLFVATDHADYQPIVTACLEKTLFFDSLHETTYVLSDPERLTTKYEAKALREGRVPFYYHFVRNSTAAPAAYPLPPELPMPHLIFTHPLSIAEIGRNFTQQDAHVDEMHIKLLEAFGAMHDNALLVEVYIAQQPLDQRFGLRLAARKDGSYIIKVHDIGFPRITTGVQAAVALLGRWVLSLHPDAQLTGGNVPVDSVHPTSTSERS